MKPWRLGMHVVCVDTNWHINMPGEKPKLGDIVVISKIDWADRQANHSNCGLTLEGLRGFFCDCHFKPATEAPKSKVVRRAPSPARELEIA